MHCYRFIKFIKLSENRVLPANIKKALLILIANIGTIICNKLICKLDHFECFVHLKLKFPSVLPMSLNRMEYDTINCIILYTNIIIKYIVCLVWFRNYWYIKFYYKQTYHEFLKNHILLLIMLVILATYTCVCMYVCALTKIPLLYKI